MKDGNKRMIKYKSDISSFESREDYLKEFRSKSAMRKNQNGETKQRAALREALDIRKFEIDLYWKRANYFWLFVTAVFTSYFLVLTKEDALLTSKDELLILLSGLGSFLSCCWFFVNKGSKYWQENWEKHVDLLEDDVMGPLYKTTLEYDWKWFDRICPLKPYNYSVGKINQLLSFGILLVWIFLFCHNISNKFGIYEPFEHFNIEVIILGIFLLFVLLLAGCQTSKTNGGDFRMKHRVFNEK
jgi:hypothetical protein